MVSSTIPVWTGVALAAATQCSGSVPPPVEDLNELIRQLQNLIMLVAVPGAALGYSYAGVLWQTGSPELQRRARRVFRNVTIGLVVILLSDGLVAIVKTPFCGGG